MGGHPKLWFQVKPGLGLILGEGVKAGLTPEPKALQSCPFKGRDLPFCIPVVSRSQCPAGLGWELVEEKAVTSWRRCLPEGNSPRKGGSCESLIGKQAVGGIGPPKRTSLGTTGSITLTRVLWPRGSAPRFRRRGENEA